MQRNAAMSEMDGIIQEFLIESYDNLDQLDRDFILLETSADDPEKLARIFRTIHTIKGTCGFLGFSKLEELTHAGENLLGLLRGGKLHLTTGMISTLLAMVDAVRALLSNIETFNEEGDRDYSALIHSLNTLHSNVMEPLPNSGSAATADPHAVCNAVASPVIATSCAIEQNGDGADTPFGPTRQEISSECPPAAMEARTATADSTIRVDVGVLDELMKLVGELVLARNHLLQFGAAPIGGPDPSFAYATQRLNVITTNLQEGVMKTRMQPVRSVWQKFPRLVRDLATACGKRVRMDTEGQDTELDKTLIEAIKDPLTHLIRNCVDHGIERPEVRTACGKSAQGRLLLRAYHEAGQVAIEISDDGAGIDVDAVKQKAVQKGLINSAQAAGMNDREALNLIFLPGFSTALQVTNVSGRGVGMDVVKTNIEKIGGSIDLQSVAGRGATVKMRIPLTLAIIPALIVNSGSDRFAIPQVSVRELVRLEAEEARRSIEMIHSSPVYRLRGKLLPIVHLSYELSLATRGKVPSLHGPAMNIVVLQAGAHQFGLVVDGVQNTEEIVVKPLGKQLKSIAAYAGATIMGDGRIALILDVQGIYRGAGVALEKEQSSAREQQQASEIYQHHLIICELRDGVRVALPVEAIERLEQFPPSRVERLGSREVVQYRGDIMPLLDVATAMHERGLLSAEVASSEDSVAAHSAIDRGANSIPVIVHRRGRIPIGIRVERILDVCLASVDELRPPQRPGTRGTLVIGGRVTELLDVTGLADLVVAAQDHEMLGVPVESR
jgi:two-component system, chemotaxis family, sensor kinase CheA